MILFIKRGILCSMDFEKKVKQKKNVKKKCEDSEGKDYPGTELERKKYEDSFF